MREILLEMYEKLWEADKDKFAWNAILKETLEKLEKKDTDKLLAMMEALHEMAQDRLIDLMNRDLNNNGTEND